MSSWAAEVVQRATYAPTSPQFSSSYGAAQPDASAYSAYSSHSSYSTAAIDPQAYQGAFHYQQQQSYTQEQEAWQQQQQAAAAASQPSLPPLPPDPPRSAAATPPPPPPSLPAPLPPAAATYASYGQQQHQQYQQQQYDVYGQPLQQQGWTDPYSAAAAAASATHAQAGHYAYSGYQWQQHQQQVGQQQQQQQQQQQPQRLDNYAHDPRQDSGSAWAGSAAYGTAAATAQSAYAEDYYRYQEEQRRLLQQQQEQEDREKQKQQQQQGREPRQQRWGDAQDGAAGWAQTQQQAPTSSSVWGSSSSTYEQHYDYGRAGSPPPAAPPLPPSPGAPPRVPSGSPGSYAAAAGAGSRAAKAGKSQQWEQEQERFPPSFAKYVQRSLLGYKEGTELYRARQEYHQKEYREAREAGTLFTTDWERRQSPPSHRVFAPAEKPALNPKAAKAARLIAAKVAREEAKKAAAAAKKRPYPGSAIPSPSSASSSSSSLPASRPKWAQDYAPNEQALQRRAKRFESGQHHQNGSYSGASSAGGSSGGSTAAGLLPPLAPADGGGGAAGWSGLTVVGTCQKLDKEYFRLTSAPDPATVRPREVLVRHLENLRQKWKNDENVDYHHYMVSQLKAIRQDATVQHIADDFTVNLYTTHARIALEMADLNEYNQCQTQLRYLYRRGLGRPQEEAEFLAYRMLYCVYLSTTRAHRDAAVEIASTLREARPALRAAAPVGHAMQVAGAMKLVDYVAFFELYRTAPNMGGYLMDAFCDNLRCRALQRMLKTYRPSVPVAFVVEQLALEAADGREILQKSGIVFTAGGDSIECAASVSAFDPSLFTTSTAEKRSLL